MRPSVPDVHITDSGDAELEGYRPLSAQAVAALILGLAAPLALVEAAFLLIPGLGIVLSWLALRKIRQSAMIGRKIALTGMVLSLICLSAVPARDFAYQRMIDAESQEFCLLWFKFLTRGEPQKAFQLTVDPRSRQSLTDDTELWTFYRTDRKSREKLRKYVKGDLVRTLLALLPRAHVQYNNTIGRSSTIDSDDVYDVYAVTYEDQGERRSMLVNIRVERRRYGCQAGWCIVQISLAVPKESESALEKR
jgi:hypothetical protein